MACCIPLDISSVFLWKYYFQNFDDYFCAFWIFRSFPGFFSTCFEISVWNLVYTCSRWCYRSSSSFILIGTLWPTFHPKIGQSHLSAFMALDLVHTLKYSECLDPCWFLSCLGNFWPSGGQKTWKGELVKLPASDTWGLSFIRIRSLPLKSFLDFF